MAANGTPREQAEEIPENAGSSPEVTRPVNQPNTGPASRPNYVLYVGIGVGVLALLVIIGAGAFLFLRGSGPPSAGSTLALVPEDTEFIVMFNFREALDSLLVDAFPDRDPQEMVGAMLGEFSEEFDIDPDDISELVIISVEGPELILKGDFIFDDVRDVLEDEDLEEDSYRGYEVWTDNSYSFALLEEDGFMILGPEEGVEKLLNNLYRERGSLANSDDSDLKRIIDRLDGDQFILASTQDDGCNEYLSRCQGMGISFTSFDLDKEEVLGNYVLLFSSERAAESAADEYDEVSDFMERGNTIDIDDAESDGEFVVGTARGLAGLLFAFFSVGEERSGGFPAASEQMTQPAEPPGSQ